jgi:DNA polymerase-1
MVANPTKVSIPDRLTAIDDAVVSMERTGVFVDVGFCNDKAALAAQHEAEAWERLKPWVNAAGGDIQDIFGTPLLYRDDDDDEVRGGESPVKLQDFLHNPSGGVGIEPSPFWRLGRCKPGEVKTDAKALEYLAGKHADHRPALLNVLALRRARGCLKYLRKLPLFVVPSTGRVHAVFGPASDGDDRVGALTGRLAIKKPELMQIPRNPKKDIYGLRNAFTAQGKGRVVLAVDYSALEVVLLAHFCAALFGDLDLAAAVARGAVDIHSVHTIRVYRDILAAPELLGVQPEEVKKHADPVVNWYRELIKAIWYGLQYGKGAWGFGSTLFNQDGSALGDEAAQKMIDALLDARPGVRLWQDWVWQFIQEHHGIPSLGGRWCDLTDLMRGDEWRQKRAHRRALNFPEQAGAADLVGWAMHLVNTDEVLRQLGFSLILQIHDELVLEGPECNAEEALMRTQYLMENAWPLLCDLQATGHYANTWGGCKG